MFRWARSRRRARTTRPISSRSDALRPSPTDPGAHLERVKRLKFSSFVATPTCTQLAVAEFLAPGGAGFVLVPWQPIVLFGVLANVCYTLGPVIESTVHKIWGNQLLPIGPGLYRMGLTFSVGLALLPGMIFTISLIIRVILAVVGVI